MLKLETIIKLFEDSFDSKENCLNISWSADDGYSYYAGVKETVKLMRSALKALESNASEDDLKKIILQPRHQ